MGQESEYSLLCLIESFRWSTRADVDAKLVARGVRRSGQLVAAGCQIATKYLGGTIQRFPPIPKMKIRDQAMVVSAIILSQCSVTPILRL